MDPELQALIQKGIDAGYSDEDIKSLGEEYTRRKTPQLAGPSHATTIQQDPSGPVKRAIDTALYEAKGVPGIVAGGVKNVVGGLNSVLGLVHAPRIPIDTEPVNLDQLLGSAGATAAQMIPAGTGVVKGVEAAVPVATRTARAAVPVAGGVAGATEGYRRGGLPGAIEGGVIGYGLGHGGRSVFGRIMGGMPKAAEAVEAASTIPEGVQAADAEARAWATRNADVAPSSTPVPAPGSMGGPLANPAPKAVHDSQAIRDMSNPNAQAYIEREFKANNPQFRKTQLAGTYGPRGVQEARLAHIDTTLGNAPELVASHAKAPAVSPSPRGRGVTSDVAARLANQHTPGWQDVSLEPPSSLEELMVRQEPGAPVKRASRVSEPTLSTLSPTERLRELSEPGKILSEVEIKELEQLKRIVGTSAREVGLSYAAQGKNNGRDTTIAAGIRHVAGR